MLARLSVLRTWMMVSANRRRVDEGGASIIEYALLLALLAVVAITALHFVGTSTANLLNKSGNAVAHP